VKFGIEDVNLMLSSKCVPLKIGALKSRTLLRDMNEILSYFVHFLSNLDKIQCRSCP
jgi:hypothetical protein